MNLMEKFAEPQLMHGLSMGEKLLGSGVTALMGMGVTFLVLIFLWGCIALMSRMMALPQKTAAEASAEKSEKPDASAMAAGSAFGPADRVTAAVLAAAVCAYEDGGGLRITKMIRSPGITVWSQSVHERKVIK